MTRSSPQHGASRSRETGLFPREQAARHSCCNLCSTLRRVRTPQNFESIMNMAVTAFFNPTTGVVRRFGDALDNNIVISRDAAGTILVNGGAVPILGGIATGANTRLIQGFGQ